MLFILILSDPVNDVFDISDFTTGKESTVFIIHSLLYVATIIGANNILTFELDYAMLNPTPMSNFFQTSYNIYSIIMFIIFGYLSCKVLLS